MLLIKTTLVVAISYWVTSVNCDVAVMTRRRQNGTRSTSQDEVVMSSAPAGHSNVQVRRCTENVSSVEMCRGTVRYNYTGWPNLVGDNSLIDAEIQLRTFAPLIQYGCAKRQLTFFLCAVYVPMCTEKVIDVIGPCRPVCQRARDRCEPLLQTFGFAWPAALDCSRFPARNDDTHMCMEGPSVDDIDVDEVDVVKHRSPSRIHKVVVQFNSNTASLETARSNNAGKRSSVSTECLLTHNETVCRAPCVWVTTKHPLVSVWMVVIAIICVASTLFCIATFVVDTRRFACSERVVMLMGSCSAICSVTVLVNVVLSSSTSLCRSHDPIPASSHCMIVFVLLYYCSLSSSTWWVVLNVVWMLTSGLRWSEGDVRRLTTWFHVVAWSVPAVLLFAVLVHKDVELDVVSGLCRVTCGTVSHVALVSAPLLVCLIVGLALRVVALVCSRRQNDVQQSSTSSSEASTVRVGVMSVVGGTALAGFTGSIIYEFAAHRYTAEHGVTAHTDSTSTTTAATVTRVICPLLIGVITAPWMVLTGQATASWRLLIRRQLGAHWQCCVEAADEVAITSRPSTVRHITSHPQTRQLLLDDVTNTAACTVPQYHQRHQLRNYHYHQQQQQQQQQQAHTTSSDFCTVYNAYHYHHRHHHQQQQRSFSKHCYT